MNKMEKLMPKEKNVKTIIFIIVTSLCYSLYAQTISNGMYCIDYSMNDFSNCLTFETEKKFKYEYNGDTGIFEYGHGEYQFINDYLILNYNRTKPIKKGYHFSKIWTNTKDSINLQFNVFDFDSIPLPAVSIIYKDSLSKYGFNGIASNEKGFAVLNLKKDRTDLQVEISNIGFKSYKFSLDKNYNYKISVYLQKEYEGIPILNQTDTLNIVKMRRKYFVVKNKNGSETIWRKIEEEIED